MRPSTPPAANILPLGEKATSKIDVGPPLANVRNGKEALYFAEVLCNNSSYENPEHLFVLAAAYAEVGKFEDAVRVSRLGLEECGIATPEKIRKRILYAIELYKKEKPFRLDQSKLEQW